MNLLLVQAFSIIRLRIRPIEVQEPFRKLIIGGISLRLFCNAVLAKDSVLELMFVPHGLENFPSIGLTSSPVWLEVFFGF